MESRARPEPGDSPVGSGTGKTPLSKGQEKTFMKRLPFVRAAFNPVTLTDENAHEGALAPKSMSHDVTLLSAG